MKSYTIHLIRHGVCEGNLEGRYVGRTQSPLAREGIQALLELKRKGTYPEAVKYYASPMRALRDTLKVLYPTADPEVILELAECDFGDWENKKAEELQNDPRFYRVDERRAARGAAERREQHRVHAARLRGLRDARAQHDDDGRRERGARDARRVIMTILAAYGLRAPR